MRVTTAFSRLLRLPGVWVRRVRFEPDRVVVRGRVAPPAAGLPRVRVLDAVSEGQAAGGLGLAALGSRDLAARGPLPPSTAVVPGARGAEPESVPFGVRVGVHTRLRMPRCVAGDADRQVDDQADAADRLGHGRADRQARMRRRARSRPPGRSLRDRHRRGQLEAPTQVPHTRGRPSPTPGGVGMRRVRPARRGRVLFRARPAARR